ncbi:MAG: methyltransferase family protein [Anaerolineales bacterium]
MNLRGLDELRKHAPALSQPGGLMRPLLAIGAVFALTTLFFLAADRGFAEWMPDGEIVVLALGFLLVSRFFSQKDVYRKKYGELAFQNAYTRFCIPGLGMIMASVAHLAYIAGPDIPDLWWKSWLAVVGWMLILIGVTLWLASVSAFGLDNAAMLYVYYPEESRAVNSGIYGMIRHPIYSGTMDVGFGLALIHGNWYALLVALILPIFFTGWVRLVEERELMQRSPAYAEYRKNVPAFWPKLRDLPKFFGFLLRGTV